MGQATYVVAVMGAERHKGRFFGTARDTCNIRHWIRSPVLGVFMEI